MSRSENLKLAPIATPGVAKAVPELVSRAANFVAWRSRRQSGFLPVALCGLSALMALAACDQGGPDTPAAPRISGELYYPERIALPEDSHALVEVRASTGELVAQWRTDTEGRQVPIEFEIDLAEAPSVNDSEYRVRGAVFSRSGPARLTETLGIEKGGETTEVGSMRLRLVDQMPLETIYQCGETSVALVPFGGSDWLIHDGRAFELAEVRAASGARYQALDNEETVFWSRGDRALVDIDGESLPDCQVLEPPSLPFVARGHEPGWRLDLEPDSIVLLADFGQTELEFPAAAPDATLSGIYYRPANGERAFEVTLEHQLCADLATGMPYPWRVRYHLDEAAHQGCGGEPKSLLRGAEWAFESLAGEPVLEDVELSMAFLDEEGRVAGGASCNRYNGGYELDAEGLRFGTIATTSMACSEEISEQEASFLALLEDVYRFSRPDHQTLVLHTLAGTELVARRSEDAQ